MNDSIRIDVARNGERWATLISTDGGYRWDSVDEVTDFGLVGGATATVIPIHDRTDLKRALVALAAAVNAEVNS